MLTQAEAAELARLMRSRENDVAMPREPVEVQLTRVRAMLVTAFGEADLAAALDVAPQHETG